MAANTAMKRENGLEMIELHSDNALKALLAIQLQSVYLTQRCLRIRIVTGGPSAATDVNLDSVKRRAVRTAWVNLKSTL